AFVNGRKVAGGHTWTQVEPVEITDHLRAGANTLAIAATNVADPSLAADKNPAGLIGLLKVEFDEGAPRLGPTDAGWRAGETEASGWQGDGFDDASWPAAQELGRLGMAPWGTLGGSNHRRLAARALRREFRATHPVRRATAYVCGLGFFDLYLNGQ